MAWPSFDTPQQRVIAEPIDPQPAAVLKYECPADGCTTRSGTERGCRLHLSRGHGSDRNRATLACQQCGDTFTVKRSRADTAAYCSNECRCRAGCAPAEPEIVAPPPEPEPVAEVQYACPIDGCEFHGPTIGGVRRHATDLHDGAGQATLECLRCGDAFTRKASHADEARYCSHECKDAARERRVERTCEWCNTEFETFECHADARFCSLSCRREADGTVLGPSQPVPDLSVVRPAEVGLSPLGSATIPSNIPHKPHSQ